jgi:hypothetical protein
VKLDFATARILCLVASAVAAGYLWRAALEGDNELRRLFDKSPAATTEPKTEAAPPASAGPVHGALAPDRLRVIRRETVVAPASRPTRHATPHVKQPKPAPSAEPSDAPGPTATLDAGESSGNEAPPPNDGASASGPPAGAPGPEEGPTGKPSTPPSRPAPAPAPKPPPPTPPPPAPTPATPVPPPAPAPPLVAASAPPVAAAVDERPGWGNGDGNHAHTGPPGQAGK